MNSHSIKYHKKLRNRRIKSIQIQVNSIIKNEYISKSKNVTGIPKKTLIKLRLEIENMTELDHIEYLERLLQTDPFEYDKWKKSQAPICLNEN